MVLKLKVPDDLVEQYETKFGTPQMYVKMKDILELGLTFEKNDRIVLLNGENRRRIEKIMDLPITDSADLAKKCEKLATFSIDGVGITFTVDELARFDAQAQFLGETRQKFMERVATEIKNFMLERA